jgi:hypothetical protein
MVKKKDGTWRPCGDFRRLNNVTTADSYPLPNMADCAARLDGCRVFSKLDLQKGYLQVPVATTDVPKTAVITPFGLFKFIRMPFGLKNAGMTFQRLMDQNFQDLPFAFIYLDDILVASRSTSAISTKSSASSTATGFASTPPNASGLYNRWNFWATSSQQTALTLWRTG